MNRRLPHPFGKIESSEQAVLMTRYSVWAFMAWAVLLGLQALLVWSGGGADSQAPLIFAGFQAALALAAALIHWRKPNRIIAAFGVAWSLYELSSVLVGIMVGLPMAIGELPAWMGALSAGVLVICAILHIGSMRATLALGRSF